MSKSHSRRAVLAGIAAAPALAAPALALTSAGPDPIYAAIEHHKTCYMALGHFLQLKDKFEEEHGRWRASPDEEWQRREDKACDAESSATAEMVATVPTTLAGVVALPLR